MGRFVAYLPDDALFATTKTIDGEAILRIAFVLEGKDRLDHIISLLSDEQLEAMILAADRERLWPEVLDLLSIVEERNIVRLAAIAAAQDGELVSRLTAAAEREGVADRLGAALSAPAATPAPARSDRDRS
jgi:hypothetical protein